VSTRGILKKLINSLDIDKNTINTFVNFLWRLVSGPLTLLFIPLFISSENQGIWFTFSSLAALSVFADLGFSTIVMQFVAHEKKNFEIDNIEDLLLIANFSKLSSLFTYISQWAKKATIIVFPVISIVGILFFMNYEFSTWFWPWVIYIFSMGGIFYINIIFAYFEGLGMIHRTQKIKFISAVFGTGTMLLFLFLGFDLYSLAFSSAILLSVNLILLIFYFYAYLVNLYNIELKHMHNWKMSINSLLWRYAISFIGGYLMFNIYTPLAFKFYGSDYAGQIGISISLVNAIFTISNVWMYVKIPTINSSVSTRNWEKLNSSFNKAFCISLLFYLIGFLIVITLFYFFGDKFQLFDRFLDIKSLWILLLSWFFQLIVNSLGTYMRAYKIEPMMSVTIIASGYVFIVTFLAAVFLDNSFFLYGFLSSYLFVIPWVVAMFFQLKRKTQIRHNTSNFS
jgi:hypothetical protein